MNKRGIITRINKFYTELLKSIKDETIKKIIKDHTFVTGGAITSMLLDEDINDFDIYFDDVESCKKVVVYYLGKLGKKENKDFFFHDYENMNTKEGEIKDRVKLYIPCQGIFKSKKKDKQFHPIFVSTNAITLTNDVQFIFRFVGNPEEIHKNYDFEHTKCYYIHNTQQLVLPQASIEAILMKELKYSGSKYPLASIIRTRKFIQRGWNINAGQFLKMAIQLQSFDLSDPIVLSDQLTGVDIVLFDMIIKKVTEKEFGENEDVLEFVSGIIDEVFDDMIIDTTINEEEGTVIIGFATLDDINEECDNSQEGE